MKKLRTASLKQNLLVLIWKKERIWNKQPCAWFDGKYFVLLNKSNGLWVITNAVKMKATKRIVLLLALNKLRKRKILFHRKMKHLLLTFTLFMQKQGYLLLFRICIASAPNSENSSPTPFIRWSTMSKGGLKKRLLERMNQFSRSFGKTEVATGVFFKKRYSLEISQNS